MRLILIKPELTCTSVEAALGLTAGDVTQLQVMRDGSLELETAVELTVEQKDQLLTWLGMVEKTE